MKITERIEVYDETTDAAIERSPALHRRDIEAYAREMLTKYADTKYKVRRLRTYYPPQMGTA